MAQNELTARRRAAVGTGRIFRCRGITIRPRPWHSSALIRFVSSPIDLTHGQDRQEARASARQDAVRPARIRAAPALRGKATRAAKPTSGAEAGYTARHIEVLEGLEPVRRRPGMYIGGTDEKALHHLFAEVIDNSMDEALDGHASFIDVEMEADGFVTVTDNGRGIPVDPAPEVQEQVARSK